MHTYIDSPKDYICQSKKSPHLVGSLASSTFGFNGKLRQNLPMGAWKNTEGLCSTADALGLLSPSPLGQGHRL